VCSYFLVNYSREFFVLLHQPTCPILSPSTLAGPLASHPHLLSPTNRVVGLQGSLCPPDVVAAAAAADGASTVTVHVHDLHSKPVARPLASYSTWQQPPLTAPTLVPLAFNACGTAPVPRLSAVLLSAARGVDAPVSSSNSPSSSGSWPDGSSGRSPPVPPHTIRHLSLGQVSGGPFRQPARSLGPGPPFARIPIVHTVYSDSTASTPPPLMARPRTTSSSDLSLEGVAPSICQVAATFSDSSQSRPGLTA
jgi:hypothetical protein